jgi:hypothetical protein
MTAAGAARRPTAARPPLSAGGILRRGPSSVERRAGVQTYGPLEVLVGLRGLVSSPLKRCISMPLRPGVPLQNGARRQQKRSAISPVDPEDARHIPARAGKYLGHVRHRQTKRCYRHHRKGDPS